MSSSPAPDAAPRADMATGAVDLAASAGPATHLLSRLVAGAAETAATFADDAESGLFPEETERIARAVPTRRREFASVRRCARAALARLGVPPAPILPDGRGAPGWPEGIVGTMTHCTGFRGAVVGWATDLAALGLDAEPNEPLPDDGVLRLVTLPTERELFPALTARRPDVCWDRLVFSAKESVFKCWYPLTRQELDFTEAEVLLDADGTFSARLLVPGPVVDGVVLQTLHGRWLAEEGLVVTALVLPRGGDTA